MATLYSRLNNNGGDTKFGGNSSINREAGSQFIPPSDWTITDITCRLIKDTGSPAGDVIVRILNDNGSDKPNSASEVASVTIPNASVGSSYSNINATFSAPFNLTGGTKYWVTYESSGSFSDTNYFAGRQVASGVGAYNNDGSTWSALTINYAFSLQGTLTASPATFYPDPDPEVTTVDGMVWRIQASGTVWADLRDGAGTGFDDSDVSMRAYGMRIESNNYREIRRSVFLFDTSPLTADVTISAATFTVNAEGKATNGNIGLAGNVYTSNPASNTALANADYDSADFGETDLSTEVAHSSWPTTGNDVDFALNATGISAISKTSITKLAIRESNFDAPDSAPGVAGFTGTDEAYCSSSDAAGTSNDPKLVVTYSTVSGPANLKTWNGLAKASVKSINGLAIGSTKSVNGLV